MVPHGGGWRVVSEQARLTGRRVENEDAAAPGQREGRDLRHGRLAAEGSVERAPGAPVGLVPLGATQTQARVRVSRR